VCVIVPWKVVWSGSSGNRYQHSWGTCCFHIQSRRHCARKCTALQSKRYLNSSLWWAQISRVVHWSLFTVSFL